jgi:alanyl-tRNA synthetase
MSLNLLDAGQLRQRYLDFFADRGHAVLPSASLVPDNDPSALFTTAGMQPLAPYLLGQTHAGGGRLANCQRCCRTRDIDEVGDSTHLTVFEMLGNWSLGQYGRAEMIPWSWEFLTGTQGLGLDPSRLFVTFFAGQGQIPKDHESLRLWQVQFATVGLEALEGQRLFGLGVKDNWWGPVGQTGPCGPDTEMFFDTLAPACGAVCRPGCGCGKYVEIWNDVFMEYNRAADGSFAKLDRACIDTGMGVERALMAVNGAATVYDTAPLQPLMAVLDESVVGKNETSRRIVADHARAALMIAADGVEPANTERGYVLRRLIRRAAVHARRLEARDGLWTGFIAPLLRLYEGPYPELAVRLPAALDGIEQEVDHFSTTLEKGLKRFERVAERSADVIEGEAAFDLQATYGFPVEMTRELATERGLFLDEVGYEAARQRHRLESRQGSEKRFAGGLADHSAQATRYHTATHLLHAALRHVLGEHVEQRGSNITAQRLRFDFAHPQPVGDGSLIQVEDLVNAAIGRDYVVHRDEMDLDAARRGGALGLFGERYGQRVSVYSVGDTDQVPVADPQMPTFSREICGGPHVAATGELGSFRIVKEQSAGRGVRRIRAVLE